MSPLKNNFKNLMKAETTYGGREWVAYFTPDLPLADGSYMFGGLPGLILEVKNKDDSYIFYASSIGKVGSKDANLSSQFKNVNATEKTYRNFILHFVKDPAAYNLKIVNEYGDSFNYEFNGKKDEKYKEMNQYLKKQFEIFDNFIDLDLPFLKMNLQ